MYSETPDIIPFTSPLKGELLTQAELEALKGGTLRLLDEVGVHFPSRMALEIFADHRFHGPSDGGWGVDRGQRRTGQRDGVDAVGRSGRAGLLLALCFGVGPAHGGLYRRHPGKVSVQHGWGAVGSRLGRSHAGGRVRYGLSRAEHLQLGQDSVYTALMVAQAGADLAEGLGMIKASTLLVPEQIMCDDEIYHTHRVLAEGVDVDSDSLAVDVIADVGPRGHFLAQKHTRRRVREIWIPESTHPRPSRAGEPLGDVRERARAKLDRVLAEHEPEPLEEAVQAELRAILDSVEREMGT